MSPGLDLTRTYAAIFAIREAEKLTTANLHAQAQERIETALVTLARVAGLGDSEVSLIRLLLVTKQTRGLTDYELAHLDGRILSLSETLRLVSDSEPMFSAERDQRPDEEAECRA